jgi:phosphotransferase system IIA component
MADEIPTARRTLPLVAPLSGYLVSIERVPGPIFSQKIAGGGIAPDPVSQWPPAPCDGEGVVLHPANHASTPATAGGIELLMHTG